MKILTIAGCLLPLVAALITLGIWAGETRAITRTVAEDVKELRTEMKDLQQSQLSWIRSVVDEEKRRRK